MEAKPIKIGVVGAGRNTVLRHIPGLLALENVQVAGVCNRSRESSQRVADQFRIPRVYDSWQELVQSPDIDAVVIGTWPNMHCPVTLAALAAGKHVLCEARMAMNVHEAMLMRDAARANPHLVAQVVPSPFTLHLDKTIQRLIGEGYLGQLLAIEVRDTGGVGLDQDSPLHWRQSVDLSGVNMLNLGIWYEALMRWAGEAQRVMASGKVFVKTRRDPSTGVMKAVRVPEHINVIAEMACGAQASYWLSSVAGLPGRKEAFLFGSSGALQFLDGQLFGKPALDTPFQQITPNPEDVGAWRVEAEFVGAIRGQETIQLTTFEDGVKYMQFTEAVAVSMAENRGVVLPVWK